ncbi:MAG TPA: EamA family transporter [Jiangellaceae bacterium]|nr:EamA family transporter [Jiangellaceae bacterium]
MSRRGWVLFLAMGLIWGVPYLMIKVAVEEFSPATLVLARTAIAAVILVPVAATKGQLRPLLPYWRPLLAYTLVELCIPWVLLGYAEQTLSSSLTGLLVAAVPLVGALLVWVTGHERVERRRVAGLLVGFAGVALLVGFDVGSANLGALLAIVGVVVGYALGPLLLARYLSHLPALGVVAASIGLTAIGYLPVGLLQRPSRSPSAEAWLSVVGLAIVCTALAFLVFFALIAEVGPARATVITYVNPAVAIALGVLVLGESLTVSIIAGFVLILAGSVLATVRDRAPDRAAAVRDGGLSGECLAEPIPEP